MIFRGVVTATGFLAGSAFSFAGIDGSRQAVVLIPR
jgi:hypothetical protein